MNMNIMKLKKHIQNKFTRHKNRLKPPQPAWYIFFIYTALFLYLAAFTELIGQPR